MIAFRCCWWTLSLTHHKNQPQLARRAASVEEEVMYCHKERNRWNCQPSDLILNGSLCKLPRLIFFPFPFYKIICNHSWWWCLFASSILWFLSILLSRKSPSRLQDRPLWGFLSLYPLVLLYFVCFVPWLLLFFFASSSLSLALLLALSSSPFHSVFPFPCVFGMWRECHWKAECCTGRGWSVRTSFLVSWHAECWKALCAQLSEWTSCLTNLFRNERAVLTLANILDMPASPRVPHAEKSYPFC